MLYWKILFSPPPLSHTYSLLSILTEVVTISTLASLPQWRETLQLVERLVSLPQGEQEDWGEEKEQSSAEKTMYKHVFFCQFCDYRSDCGMILQLNLWHRVVSHTCQYTRMRSCPTYVAIATSTSWAFATPTVAWWVIMEFIVYIPAT